jgi:Arc/MetJ family transcription regulator
LVVNSGGRPERYLLIVGSRRLLKLPGDDVSPHAGRDTPQGVSMCTVRTNIEIDDELVERAMKVYQLSTKRAVVELALQRLVDSMTTDEKLAMEGSGWEGDLNVMRQAHDDDDLSLANEEPR